MTAANLNAEEPIFKAFMGQIYYRGVYLPRQNAEKLMDLFASEDDERPEWFRTTAGQLYWQVRRALREAYGAEE